MSIRNTFVCLAFITYLYTNNAIAAPVVNGATISWPDDGWYQVQTADGLTSLCNGGRSCVVEPGTYIVINHTTNQRYPNIVVGGGVAPDSSITVTGNTISWPDDGWYQVQTADGLKSLCNGGRSCVVEPGTYIVINHTTHRRYPNIVVDGGTAPDSPITIDGNTISWPDNGWYQVQTSDGLTSLCNGGRRCEVEPGTYIVINHTSGERFTDIVVSGSSDRETLDDKLNRYVDLSIKVGKKALFTFNEQYASGTLPENLLSDGCTNVNLQWPFRSVQCSIDEYYPLNNIIFRYVSFISYTTFPNTFQYPECANSIAEGTIDECLLSSFVIFDHNNVKYSMSARQITSDGFLQNGGILIREEDTRNILCDIDDFQYFNVNRTRIRKLSYGAVTPSESACKVQLDNVNNLMEKFLEE